MMNSEIRTIQNIDSLAADLKGEILYSAPMSQYTSFRVGGKVDALAFPADLDDLQRILRWCGEEGVEYFILGNGTNLLVRDGGIRGLAISLGQGFFRIEEVERSDKECWVFAEAGPSLGKLVEFAWKRELAGLEFAAGIPGSIGGAIFMNAGAFQGEMKNILHSVRLVDAGGNLREKEKEELAFFYRSLKLPKGEIILGGTFRLQTENGQAIRSKVEEILRRRQEKQPLDLPSAGSVFKNPSQGPAGRLIEQIGLKGKRLGDAQISEKHANFIVNRGRAKAQDILALAELVRERVWQEKGVRLEMEIQVVGED